MPRELGTFFKRQGWLQWAGLISLGLVVTTTPVLAQEDIPKTTQPVSQTALDGYYDLLLEFPTISRFNNEFESRIDTTTQVSDETTSDTHPTLPSLWWSRDQLPRRLGGNRLINSWLAYRILDPSVRVVDVSVNSQIWSILNYTERYAVLNQFGTAAKDYGYSLRIFQGSIYSPQIIGVYVCDFGQQSSSENGSSETVPLLENAGPTSEIPCHASLDLFGIQGFRGATADSPFGD
ncbi:MAG TPA: hypothetical protein V6D07_11165 [Trichocoleus sp.]